MSCAEVMYHPQPYGAPQYLPNPVAAATCPTACYHPAPQPGQQKKLAVYSKMQDSLEVTLPSKQEEEEEEEDEDEEEEVWLWVDRCPQSQIDLRITVREKVENLVWHRPIIPVFYGS